MGIHLYGDQNMCFCPRVIAKQSGEGPQLFSSSIPYTPDKLCCDFFFFAHSSHLLLLISGVGYSMISTLMAYHLLAKMY